MERIQEESLRKLSELSISALACCLIVLMVTIGLQVLFSALDINPVATFETRLPLLDNAITLNTLLDFQWHLLVIVGLMPIGLVWLMDRHVRVDFFFQTLPGHRQRIIDLSGNAIFALPFFWLVIPAAWNFMQRAWVSDEGSRNSGLADLWLIKALFPFGFSLLAAAIVLETFRILRERP